MSKTDSPEKQLHDIIKAFENVENEAAEKARLEKRSELLAQLSSLLGNLKTAPTPKAKPAKSRKARATKPSITALAAEVLAEEVASNGGGAHVDKLAVQRAIEDTPGQRVEQLARAFELPSKAMGAIVKRLTKDGTVRSEGKARATAYYPVSASAEA